MPRLARSSIVLSVLCAGLLGFWVNSLRHPNYGLHGQYRFIAHALGGWNGVGYLNCIQCFWSSYAQGVRYFEVDLAPTADGHYVAFHDSDQKRFGLPQSFTLKEFLSVSPAGATLIDVGGVAEFLRRTSDTYLVTDAKERVPELVSSLCEAAKSRGISCYDRIIPQIYDPSELEQMKSLGFSKVIFTLYRFGNEPKRVFEFVRANPEVVAVTIPYTIYSEEYREELHKLGRKVFVHTLNDPALLREYFAKGVDGIYSAGPYNLQDAAAASEAQSKNR